MKKFDRKKGYNIQKVIKCQKKSASLFLVLSLWLCFRISPALDVSADDSASSETQLSLFQGFYYNLNTDGTINILHYTGSSASVTVPSSIDGKDVVCIE